jgi:hypothetical protein
MKTSKATGFEGRHFLALLALVALMWAGKPAWGQMSTQPGPTGPPTIQPRDDDAMQREMASFDKYLDGHPEIAEQLRKNPSLINDKEFVERHPELQEYLQQHPRVREEISENPNGFMRQENRFDRREDQAQDRDRDRNRDDRDRDRDRDFDRDREGRRGHVAVFDGFLDRHTELAEQLRKDPSLVNNQEFVESHPALQQFLRDNPGIGTEINENPRAFMHEEERFDRNDDRFNRSDDRSDRMNDRGERTDRDRQSASGDRDERTASGDRDERAGTVDRDERATADDRDRDDRVHGESVVGARAEGEAADRDATSAQLASSDRFFDSHPEIAEQLQKNPSLIDDKNFVKNHPELREYLKSHPEIRQEIRQNPNEFMRQEARYDQREALSTHRMDRDDMASFSTFLGGHAGLAQELSKNPSLANNKEFQASHPELKEFLKTHPAMQAQLSSNPATVMSSVQGANAARGTAPKPQMKH